VSQVSTTEYSEMNIGTGWNYRIHTLPDVIRIKRCTR